MDYVQDVELQRDEACLKRVFFPQRQWNDSINLRGWSLPYPMKGLYYSTETHTLHSPQLELLCAALFTPPSLNPVSRIFIWEASYNYKLQGISVYVPCEHLCCRTNQCQLEKFMLTGWEYLRHQWLRKQPQAGVGEEAFLKPLRQKLKATFTSRADVERPQSFLSLSSFRFQREGRKRKLLGIYPLRKDLKLLFSM